MLNFIQIILLMFQCLIISDQCYMLWQAIMLPSQLIFFGFFLFQHARETLGKMDRQRSNKNPNRVQIQRRQKSFGSLYFLITLYLTIQPLLPKTAIMAVSSNTACGYSGWTERALIKYARFITIFITSIPLSQSQVYFEFKVVVYIIFYRIIGDFKDGYRTFDRFVAQRSLERTCSWG